MDAALNLNYSVGTIQMQAIPEGWFYCPYWILQAIVLTVILTGFVVGYGSAYGWRQLFWRVQTLLTPD